MDALDAAGYGRFDVLLTAPILAGYSEIMMDNGMYADLMTDIPGLSAHEFDACFAKATTDEVNGIAIRFVSYEHLIKNKITTGRPKDLADVEALRQINDSSGL